VPETSGGMPEVRFEAVGAAGNIPAGSLIHNTSPVCEDPRCASPARRFGSPPFEIEFHRLGGLARDYHLWITSHLVSIVVSIDVSFGAE
jgi:hypothetical protein